MSNNYHRSSRRFRTHGIFRDAVFDIALDRKNELYQKVQEHQH